MDGTNARLLFFLLRCVTAAAFSTYLIEERANVCFFKFVETTTSLHAQVFVLKGGTKLDVGFSIHGPIERDPHGHVSKSRAKNAIQHVAKIAADDLQGDDSSGYEYKFEAPRGEYEICLSNTYPFEQVPKHVMLDISEEVSGDADGSQTKPTTDSQDADESRKKDLNVITTGLEEVEKVFEEVRKRQVQERMQLTRRVQDAESNHESMVQSSVIETVVLLLVGMGQIFFVRKWFSGKGTLLKQWT